MRPAIFLLVAGLVVPCPAPAQDIHCPDLLNAVRGFDQLGNLLTGLQNDPFAPAFRVYIQDIEKLKPEGERQSDAMLEIVRTECEPWLQEKGQWLTLETDLRNSGCIGGTISPEQAAACKPRYDGYVAWRDRLEARRGPINQRIAVALAEAATFTANAKQPLLNAENVLNPDNSEDAYKLYMWWYLKTHPSPLPNSCEAFAHLATVLGQRVKNRDYFIQFLTRNLIERNSPLRRIIVDPPSTGPLAANSFGGTGFKRKYAEHPHDNQVRHAAGHMMTGYSYAGAGVGGSFGFTLESDLNFVESMKKSYAARYITFEHPEWDDYYLALAASMLGFRLRHGMETVAGFGDAIRRELCN